MTNMVCNTMNTPTPPPGGIPGLPNNINLVSTYSHDTGASFDLTFNSDGTWHLRTAALKSGGIHDTYGTWTTDTAGPWEIKAIASNISAQDTNRSSSWSGTDADATPQGGGHQYSWGPPDDDYTHIPNYIPLGTAVTVSAGTPHIIGGGNPELCSADIGGVIDISLHNTTTGQVLTHSLGFDISADVSSC